MRGGLPFWMFAASLMLSLSSTPSAASLAEVKKRQELRVAMEPGFLPFGMKKANGEWIGFDIDMMTEFAKFLKVKPMFLDVKWDGAIPALMAKKFDMIVNAVTITEERAKTVGFSDPYYQAGLAGMVKKSLIGKITKIEQLNDPAYTVVVQLGTTGDIYAAKHLPKAKIVKMDSNQDASNSVVYSKMDAVINDKPFITLAAKKNPGKVGVLEANLSEEHFGVVGRKEDQDLLKEYNRFLAQWKKSGGYDASLKRNFDLAAQLK